MNFFWRSVVDLPEFESGSKYNSMIAPTRFSLFLISNLFVPKSRPHKSTPSVTFFCSRPFRWRPLHHTSLYDHPTQAERASWGMGQSD